MKFDSNTPRVEFTIAETVVTIPVLFFGGHPCTDGEAEAMNQLLRENVRNNLAGKVKAGKVDFVTQEMVDEYVTDYEFGVRATGPKRSRDEIVLGDVILEFAKARAAKRGVKLPPAKPKSGMSLQEALDAVYRADKAEIDKEVKRRLKLVPTDTEEVLW